ncbi:unnamed protein product [Cladocopium goreaui]|uniref:SET domain-containing protein L678 n=1 Tax=Cladocopium goreaui TaxID=2562237 RepID=A0A9P1CRV3_9DINO|nr:unnamed protein product [Cladocopium goreaui]
MPSVRSHKQIWQPVPGQPGQRWGALELQHVPGGGLCWVASHALSRGEILESGEAPLACWSLIPGKQMEASCRAFLQLSARKQHVWQRLTSGDSNMPEAQHLLASSNAIASKVAGELHHGHCGVDVRATEKASMVAKAAIIAHLNAFCTEHGLAIYENCSRFNHSCVPNAEYGVNEQGHMKVRVIKPVAQGEKVCFSYLGDSLLSREPRQQFLRHRYFFDCACDLCSLPEDVLAGRACCDTQRLLPSETCSHCGSGQDIDSADLLERSVATLAMQGEPSEHEIQQLQETCRKLHLQFHAVAARLSLLSFHARVAMLAQIGMNLELVYKAWEDLQFLRGCTFAVRTY